MPPFLAFCLGLLAGACVTLLILAWLAALLEPTRFERVENEDDRA